MSSDCESAFAKIFIFRIGLKGTHQLTNFVSNFSGIDNYNSLVMEIENVCIKKTTKYLFYFGVGDNWVKWKMGQ